jgi:hypothetical protein
MPYAVIITGQRTPHQGSGESVKAALKPTRKAGFGGGASVSNFLHENGQNNPVR